MKVLLRIAIVLSVVTAAAHAHSQEEKSSEVLNTEQHEKNIELCTQNLVVIGKAIQAYEKEEVDFPEWLSDLHPKYLGDASVLICPEDTEGGKAVFTRNIDPKMPMSYEYQFHPQYREFKGEQRLVYGDVIPLVRCGHHANADFECLNLSFAANIYKSPRFWEHAPAAIYGSHEAAIDAFEEKLEQHLTDIHLLQLYPLLADLYLETGNDHAADALVERFKSKMKSDVLQYYFTLGDILRTMGRFEDMREALQKAEEHYPDNRSVLGRLASIHRKLGNVELAEEYKRKADPAYELIGKLVPDFSATDLDGQPISLEAYRGKVVLLDFWAVWCGPCIMEMPNVKKVYNTYKDKGFDIIGVSLDYDETKLRGYLKENDIPWRQIFSGEGGKAPIAQQYGIREIPTPWLIDREGKLITHKARGASLERLVAEAVKSK